MAHLMGLLGYQNHTNKRDSYSYQDEKQELVVENQGRQENACEKEDVTTMLNGHGFPKIKIDQNEAGGPSAPSNW